MFDDEFSTVTFTREDTIPQNWKHIVQRSSQSGAPESIVFKDNLFIPDLEKDHSITPTHVLIFSPENNINMVTPSNSV